MNYVYVFVAFIYNFIQFQTETDKSYPDFNLPANSNVKPAVNGIVRREQSVVDAVSVVAQLYDTRLCKQIVEETLTTAVESRLAADLVINLVLDKVAEMVSLETVAECSPSSGVAVDKKLPLKVPSLPGSGTGAKKIQLRKSPRGNRKDVPEKDKTNKATTASKSDSNCDKKTDAAVAGRGSFCDRNAEIIDQPPSSPPIIVKIPKIRLSPIRPTSAPAPQAPASSTNTTTPQKVCLVNAKESTPIKDLSDKLRLPSESKAAKTKVNSSPTATENKKKSELKDPVVTQINSMGSSSVRVPVLKIKEPTPPKVSSLKIAPLVPPALNKLKIRLNQPKVSKLRISIKGRKAAKIIKNSKLLKKNKLKREKATKITPAPPVTARVSKVTVLKMSEILSMKPKKTEARNEKVTTSFPTGSLVLNSGLEQTDLKTPVKEAVSSLPQLKDEFSSLDVGTGATVAASTPKKVIVKDPKQSSTSPKKLKTRIHGIKPFKAKKKISQPETLEKKKTALELIMEKIPPSPILPMPTAAAAAIVTPAPTLKRHPSGNQKKESWLIGNRQTATTPDVMVAKKSQPQVAAAAAVETVSFSLPPGGFRGERCIEQVPWRRVDELFSQFYPDAATSVQRDTSRLIVADILDSVLCEVETMATAARSFSPDTNAQRLVSCKGMQAIIDLDRYMSGDQGECILMEQGWITPDLFLKRSGHRSKNHRKSINVEGLEDLGTVLDKLRGNSPTLSARKSLAAASRKSPTPPPPSTSSPCLNRRTQAEADQEPSPPEVRPSPSLPKDRSSLTDRRECKVDLRRINLSTESVERVTKTKESGQVEGANLSKPLERGPDQNSSHCRGTNKFSGDSGSSGGGRSRTKAESSRRSRHLGNVSCSLRL